MNNHVPILKQALSLARAGQLTQARCLVETHLAAHPEDGVAHELAGMIAFAARDFSACGESLARSAALDQLSLGGCVMLGDSYRFRQLPAQASGWYRLARQRLLRDATNEIPLTLLSRLIVGISQVGDHFDALELCRLAVSLNPHCEQARFGLAHHMSKAGYPPELIIPIVYRALELNPLRFRYRVTLAALYLQLAERPRAYLAVADATDSELCAVGCRCCWERLAALFAAGGDSRRRDLCLQLAAKSALVQKRDHDWP